jgi:CheY-like chemotaxis protein/nitrogen-specific signal transduction histidine kinase
MGVIYLSDKIDGEFTADDEAILTQLSQMAVIAIENHINAEARQANRAKDQFIAVLSHELRTPLTPALVALSEMCGDKRLPQDAQDNLEMVRRNVELEARLIDDLLDLTRISKGKIDLRLATVDLHGLLRETQTVCDADLHAKAISATLHFDATQTHVRGDRARLQQIFWNLLKNAVKFTPTGGSIRISTENGPDGRLAVKIRDTGIGIEPTALPRIFNAFEQGDKLIGRQFGGLGLGLAITKALVESHGGAVTAASDGRGQGALFTVTLPTQAAQVADRQLALPRLVESGPPRRLRILLVEDHADTSQVLKRLLTKQLHEVRAVHTVADAIAAAEMERFDLIISDIGLPDGSGLELMPKLRQLGATVGIALSGFGMEEDVARSRAAGFREHLTKPLNFQTLADCIDRICVEMDRPPELSKRIG